jgi:hypothetical protein
MHRLAFIVVIFVSAMTAVAVRAQQATPNPLFLGLPADIAAWQVGQFAQSPATYRLEFAPGASLPGYDDETLSLAYVEAGSVVLNGKFPLVIARLDGSAPRTVEAGTEAMAEAGDYFVLPPHAPTEIRNRSQEPASLQFAAMDPLHPVIIDQNQTQG